MLALGTKNLPSGVAFVAAQPLRAVGTGKLEIAHGNKAFNRVLLRLRSQVAEFFRPMTTWSQSSGATFDDPAEE